MAAPTRSASADGTNVRREELVDLAAHDIRTTLRVVEAAVEMLEMDLADAALALPMLRRASGRIGSLVQTLLDVSRLRRGVMPLALADVPWAVVCEPLLAEMGLPAQARGVRFVRTGDAQAIVRCDPALVERVLLNLVDHALAAAPDGTTVDVHTERRPGGAFLVRVGHRGPAIPADVLATLFDEHASQTDGASLGRTFCRLAVERHGGTIRAVSPYADGRGAAFEVELPADPRGR